MAAHHGNEGKVKVGANSVAEVQDWSYDEEPTDVQPKLSMGDTEETYIASGAKRGSGNVTCLWDETDTTGQGAMTPGATVALGLYPEGDVSGDTELTGNVVIGQVSKKGAKDGLVEATFAFQGVLTEGTVV